MYQKGIEGHFLTIVKPEEYQHPLDINVEEDSLELNLQVTEMEMEVDFVVLAVKEQQQHHYER